MIATYTQPEVRWTINTLSDKVGWCVAYGIVAFAVCVGNSLSIAIFVVNRRLRRMRASYLIINLSVADLVVGAVTLPMYIIYQLAGPHIVTITFRTVFDSVDLLSGFGSVIGLVVIALERTYSVYWPHRYRATNKKVYVFFVCLVWLLAGFLSILRATRNLLTFQAFFYSMVTCLSISILILTFAYVLIWYRVKCSHATVHTNRQTREHAQDKKLALTLAIVTGVFILTWLPFHIVNIIFFVCGPTCPLVISLHSVYAIKFLHYANSLLNPVIYALQLPEFRKTLWKLLGRSSRVYPETFSVNTVAASPRTTPRSTLEVREINSQQESEGRSVKGQEH